MIEKAHRPKPAAERGIEPLLRKMRRLIGLCVFRIPHFGAHTRRADDLDNLIIAKGFSAFQNRHPAVQYIKG